MALTKVTFNDFLCFKGELTVELCPGINVLIGGNATGKTTIMKALYAACDYSCGKRILLGNYFEATENKAEIQKEIADNKLSTAPHIEIIADANSTALKIWSAFVSFVDIDNNPGWSSQKIEAVYIPTTPMLPHSKSLMGLNHERFIPFNETEIAILAKSQLGEARNLNDTFIEIREKIEAVIDGVVVYENDTFYVKKKKLGKTIPFSYEASGYRKFGLLWKLLRNGLIKPGGVLFWDEPEASINAEHIPLLADILLDLQRGGVQIVLATHGYDLARWLDVKATERETTKNEMRFFNLTRENDGHTNIVFTQFCRDLPKNVLDDADGEMVKAEIEVAVNSIGGDDDDDE